MVSLAPTRGMAACLTVIFVGEALLIAFGFVEQRPHGLSAWSTFVFASAFVAAAPLLAGGAIARRRVTTSMGLLQTVVR